MELSPSCWPEFSCYLLRIQNRLVTGEATQPDRMPKKQAPKEQAKETESTVAQTKAKEDAPVASTKHIVKSTEKIPIKGQPVSGKPWRNISTKTRYCYARKLVLAQPHHFLRSSKKRVDKVFNTTWELKQKLKADMKDVKQRERALKADVAEKKKVPF